MLILFRVSVALRRLLPSNQLGSMVNPIILIQFIHIVVSLTIIISIKFYLFVCIYENNSETGFVSMTCALPRFSHLAF